MIFAHTLPATEFGTERFEARCSYCGRAAPEAESQRKAAANALSVGWKFNWKLPESMPEMVGVDDLDFLAAICPACLKREFET